MVSLGFRAICAKMSKVVPLPEAEYVNCIRFVQGFALG